MLTLLGNRSSHHSAHQSSTARQASGWTRTASSRAAIASESQLSIMVLHFDRAAQVIQHHGSRTRACESVRFRGRLAYGDCSPTSQHQASELGRVHLAG